MSETMTFRMTSLGRCCLKKLGILCERFLWTRSGVGFYLAFWMEHKGMGCFYFKFVGSINVACGCQTPDKKEDAPDDAGPILYRYVFKQLSFAEKIFPSFSDSFCEV